MNSFDEQYDAIFKRGHALEHARDRMSIWMEAFNLALSAGRLDEAMLARYYHTLDATPYDPDGAIVSFVWCTGHLEHDALVSPTRIVSLYGTITRLLYEDPKYPLDQLHKTWDEMARRFEEVGFDQNRYLYHKLYNEIAIANDDGVRDVFEQWQISGGRDQLICTWATIQDYHVYFEDHEEALHYGYRVVDSGETCVHQHPTVVRFENLVPLLELGRLEEAHHQFATAERSIDRMHNNRMWCAARAIYYLAAVGDLDRGASYFTDCYRLVLEGGSPADHHRFLTPSRSFLRRCIEAGFDTEEMLRKVGHDGTTESLLHEITTETRRIANAFDARHQNDWYNRMIDRYDALYDTIKVVE